MSEAEAQKRTQREGSYQKAMEQLPHLQRVCKDQGLELLALNNGHHWQFKRDGVVLLNFWPASAKGLVPLGQLFRIRGYHHALSIALKRGGKGEYTP